MTGRNLIGGKWRPWGLGPAALLLSLLTTAPAPAGDNGTAGYDDLARGAAKLDLDGAAVPVAGLLDLLRIADASPDPDSRRHALAYRAVLDVLRAQHQGRLAQRPRDEDEIRQWLAKQKTAEAARIAQADAADKIDAGAGFPR